MVRKPLTVMQLLPAMDAGGVEKGTLELSRYLVRHGHRAIVISDGGRMLPALLDSGIEHLCWNIGKKSPRTLRWAPRLRAKLREYEPDILHLRSRLPAWIGYLAWRGMSPERRPHLITTVHGMYTVGRYSAIMTRGERVIAVSEATRDYIRNHYPAVPSNRIRVIHRGVEPSDYPYGYYPSDNWQRDWFATYPLTRNKYLLTLPARITRLKGHEDFIEVIRKLKERGLPVHGLIVGAPHPRKHRYFMEIQKRIASAQLMRDISLTGHRGDLREIMAVSKVVLSLSREPESFGRTTIEALSLGIPVAGFNHGGVGEQLREVFPQGRIALGDIPSVVEKIEDWFREPPIVPMQHPFHLQSMLRKTVQLYEEVVSHGFGYARK
uniref:Glycosyltransferase involved in cell wall bisynthesis n=1 Tax=Candidatus Kentrum sp. TC TaxID=2126339 RepID=A0A450ZCP2_9GAMM|nr:MAG: Glycosyltransferase involved in cell wall bisynthesis [Candidatus Kentron sp. TC]